MQLDPYKLGQDAAKAKRIASDNPYNPDTQGDQHEHYERRFNQGWIDETRKLEGEV